MASPNRARRATATGLRMIEYVVSAADGHSQANVRRSTEQALAAVAEVAEVVRSGRATRGDHRDRVGLPVRRADAAGADGACRRRAIELGADQLCLATTRSGRPAQPAWSHWSTQSAPQWVMWRWAPTFILRAGWAIATLAAIQAGVTQLDASVGGMGGCPFAPGVSNNIATEELVYLDDASVRTGLDLDAVLAAAAVAQQLVGHPLESDLLRARGGRSRGSPARRHGRSSVCRPLRFSGTGLTGGYGLGQSQTS